nr:MAG TPA: hypothetical protein [Caudoviricetes sp.]
MSNTVASLDGSRFIREVIKENTYLSFITGISICYRKSI